MKTLLIDADSLLYKAGFSTEYKIRTLEKEGDIIETKSVREMKSLMEAGYELVSSVDILEPVENALHILKNAMEGIVEDCGCKNIRVFLSAPGPTFRKEIYPMYKANRTAPKPKHYYDMYSYLARIYGAEDKPGFEADDLVCIAAYELLNDEHQYLIAHIDKDLDTIPGDHYNYGSGEFYSVDPIEAEFNFYTQLLSGDSSDNIPGIQGIGKVKAMKILDRTNTPDDMWEVVKATYAELDPDVSEENIILRGNLLRLKEYKDYMWSPYGQDS